MRSVSLSPRDEDGGLTAFQIPGVRTVRARHRCRTEDDVVLHDLVAESDGVARRGLARPQSSSVRAEALMLAKHVGIDGPGRADGDSEREHRQQTPHTGQGHTKRATTSSRASAQTETEASQRPCDAHGERRRSPCYCRGRHRQQRSGRVDVTGYGATAQRKASRSAAVRGLAAALLAQGSL